MWPEPARPIAAVHRRDLGAPLLGMRVDAPVAARVRASGTKSGMACGMAAGEAGKRALLSQKEAACRLYQTGVTAFSDDLCGGFEQLLAQLL